MSNLWGVLQDEWGGVGWVSGGVAHPVRLPTDRGELGYMGGCWGVFAKKSPNNARKIHRNAATNDLSPIIIAQDPFILLR